MTIILRGGYLISLADGHQLKSCNIPYLYYLFIMYIIFCTVTFAIVFLSYHFCYRHMEGCLLEGPIPSSISHLTSLSDLYENVMLHFLLT